MSYNVGNSNYGGGLAMMSPSYIPYLDTGYGIKKDPTEVGVGDMLKGIKDTYTLLDTTGVIDGVKNYFNLGTPATGNNSVNFNHVKGSNTYNGSPTVKNATAQGLAGSNINGAGKNTGFFQGMSDWFNNNKATIEGVGNIANLGFGVWNAFQGYKAFKENMETIKLQREIARENMARQRHEWARQDANRAAISNSWLNSTSSYIDPTNKSSYSNSLAAAGVDPNVLASLTSVNANNPAKATTTSNAKDAMEQAKNEAKNTAKSTAAATSSNAPKAA